jgi:hypothetical protein
VIRRPNGADNLRRSDSIRNNCRADQRSLNYRGAKRGITAASAAGFRARTRPAGTEFLDAETGPQPFRSIAVEIDGLVGEGKHTEAVLSLKRFIKEGSFGRPGKRFLQSLIAIDVTQLPSDDRRLVRNARIEVAHGLKRFDIMGAEADAMLSEYGPVLDPEERATLRMAVALRASQQGNKETAIAIWRSLLKEPSDLTAEARGWAWRNISKDLSAHDPEAKAANKHSADAFLEAGNKDEAGRSLMGLVNILMKEDPAAAITTLNEIIELVDKEGLINRFVRTAALHARANRLSVLHQHENAYGDAAEAVALRRGLIGAEAEFVSSLHLAAIEARHLEKIDDALAFEAEANKLTDEAGLTHFQLSRRALALSKAFDATAAEGLLRDAEASMTAPIAIDAGTKNHSPSCRCASSRSCAAPSML